ncbi:DUF2845 domain-containing protein [Povalibacter sp.]|uniref:DUF2845 domain-containing protein n=1 Tax=Povalibacter sp. TaxID=1962978 RepID=UPI002F41E80D
MRTAIPILMTLAIAATVHADETIRCGSSIVNSSMARDEILAKCGEPTAKETREEEVRARNLNGALVEVGTSVIETWTYDRGSRAAPIQITIVDGKVRSIERIL